jgi:hypothetical protein
MWMHCFHGSRRGGGTQVGRLRARRRNFFCIGEDRLRVGYAESTARKRARVEGTRLGRLSQVLEDRNAVKSIHLGAG